MTIKRAGRRQGGVTLIELIVAVVILAIVGGMVAIFLQRPILGYVDASNRAELTNRADAALRRIARDVRLALPNSLRVRANTTTPSTLYLEFLITSGGGRYRAVVDGATPVAANVLDFSTTDTTFEVLGPMPAIANGNLIVVYNLFSANTVATSNAYSGDNTAAVGGVAGNIITIAATRFPFESPSKRFQVVTGAVTYECNPTAQQMRRYAYTGAAITLAQPAPPAGASDLLVDGVSACGFTYDNAGNNSTLRTGILSMNLRLTRNAENVSLQQQVHVDNVP